MARQSPSPIIIFGAFDRHNLGDLLFPHIMTRLLGKGHYVYAGLFSRDLRPFGGHKVNAIAGLAKRWDRRPANVIHVGGELLTCDAWEATVMALTKDNAAEVIAQYGADVSSRLAWASHIIGFPEQAPYIVPKRLFQNPATFLHFSIGGVDLDKRDSAFLEELRQKMLEADDVCVRDGATKAILDSAGVNCRLAADSVVLIKNLFADRIRIHGQRGEPARVKKVFPQGYMAVQFNEEFGSDATLDAIAAQINKAARDLGLAIVLFRAGAAPWHDDMNVYERFAARLPAGTVRLFESLNIWDICALLAECRVFCGTSLHARIIATAFCVPCVNFTADPKAMTKQQAYSATWERSASGGVVGISGIAAALQAAMAVPAVQIKKLSQTLAQQCREQIEKVKTLLEKKHATSPQLPGLRPPLFPSPTGRGEEGQG